MRYELKSVGYWAFFKVAFFANLILGFLVGLLLIPLMLIGMLAESAGTYGEFGAATDESGLAVFIIMPFLMAVIGGVGYTLLGLVMVGVYNLLAKAVGGFEFVLEPVGESTPGAPPVAPPPRPAAIAPPPPPPGVMSAPPVPESSPYEPPVRPTPQEAGATQVPLFEPQPPRPSAPTEDTASDRSNEAPPQL